MFAIVLIWCFTKMIKELTLIGFVLLAFTEFREEDATASDKFKVSSERVSVFTMTEIRLTPFEPLIGFQDLSS